MFRYVCKFSSFFITTFITFQEIKLIISIAIHKKKNVEKWVYNFCYLLIGNTTLFVLYENLLRYVYLCKFFFDNNTTT